MPRFHAIRSFALVSTLCLLIGASTTSCTALFDVIWATNVQGSDESYTISDAHTFAGDKANRYYRNLLDEVGQEMGFKVSSEMAEGFVWIAEESSYADAYFLGKYKGTYVTAMIMPAYDDGYQLIEGHKSLDLTVSASGNFKQVSRDQIKPLFEEIIRRYDEKLAES